MFYMFKVIFYIDNIQQELGTISAYYVLHYIL